MTNNFIISLIISSIYLVLKFLDMRYIKKESKPLKDLILDSCVVFISSLITFFLFNQFNFAHLLNGEESIPEVFTDIANF